VSLKEGKTLHMMKREVKIKEGISQTILSQKMTQITKGRKKHTINSYDPEEQSSKGFPTRYEI